MRRDTGGGGADGFLHTGLGSARFEDVGHAQQGQLLAMATGTLRRMLPPALVVGDDLVGLDRIDHLGLHGGIGHQRRADGAADHEDVVELDLLASVGGNLFNPQDVARRNAVLLAAGLQDRKHWSSLSLRALRPPG